MLRSRMAPISLPRTSQMHGGFSGVSSNWAMAQAKQRAVLALFVLVMVISLFLSLRAADPQHGMLAALWLYDGTDSVPLKPTLESRADTDLVWQIPEDARAVLFLAHGCHNKATHFWDEHPQCSTCVGLPEDRHLVLEALRRRYAVIAISSKGKKGCWNFMADAGYVKEILTSWIQEHGLGGLPLSALGASSGGFFVSRLAQELSFKSLVIMISHGSFFDPKFGQIKPTYPPSLFVHMPKDGRTAEKVGRSMELLREARVRTAEVKCNEFPITPTFFSEKIPGIDSRLSARIFSVLKDSGLLDRKGFMRMDGRDSNWQMTVKKRNVLPVEARGRLKWENHIQEELNCAYGFHEMTALESATMLDWLDDPTTAVLESV